MRSCSWSTSHLSDWPASVAVGEGGVRHHVAADLDAISRLPCPRDVSPYTADEREPLDGLPPRVQVEFNAVEANAWNPRAGYGEEVSVEREGERLPGLHTDGDQAVHVRQAGVEEILCLVAASRRDLNVPTPIGRGPRVHRDAELLPSHAATDEATAPSCISSAVRQLRMVPGHAEGFRGVRRSSQGDRRPPLGGALHGFGLVKGVGQRGRDDLVPEILQDLSRQVLHFWRGVIRVRRLSPARTPRGTGEGPDGEDPDKQPRRGPCVGATDRCAFHRGLAFKWPRWSRVPGGRGGESLMTHVAQSPCQRGPECFGGETSPPPYHVVAPSPPEQLNASTSLISGTVAALGAFVADSLARSVQVS